ncbi:MAG: glycosyltransferase family 4 protein [Desulfobulbus sp.]|jgi:teichuronic acid biosynthesis glycosyltransferase TuaC
MGNKIKLLTFSSLYPNPVQPRHGVFVENRLRHLLTSGEAESKVMAPVPWFPFSGSLFGSYGKFARVPAATCRHGIDILYPRYPVLPKIGMSVAPFLMASALLPAIRKQKRAYPFEVIDAHYFYPDGVAAVALGKVLHRPVVVTARGTDINLITQYTLPRKMILWAAANASAVITVSRTLKEKLLHLGAREDKITVLRNGVDLDVFQPPGDRTVLRSQLGIQGKTILSVGNLVENKGHDLAIKALSVCPDMSLLIAGDGPEESALKDLVVQLSLGNRVRFLGSVPHEQLCSYYGAADLLVLASSREGWPNVLLEAMACGTPVVATRVGGIPEVVGSPVAGLLVDERNDAAFAEAFRRIFAHLPQREETRRYAENFSWAETTQGQLDIFNAILKR